jgi:hypothetical protein
VVYEISRGASSTVRGLLTIAQEYIEVQLDPMSEVCRAFGISRKTGYKTFEPDVGNPDTKRLIEDESWLGSPHASWP